MAPYQLHWGIIATGWISAKFVQEIILDPKTRDTHDVVHKIVSVGSRDTTKAQDFIDTYISGDKSIKAAGSYEEVYNDKDVDAIYIGTPHAYHYVNARDAILAKKHVLCEKPVTLNAAELRSLISLAKENQVFFMEAMWTRFQPLVTEFKKIVEEGSLGDPVAMQADLSHFFDIHNLPTSHRILNPALGGGALLDLAPYPMVWAVIALYEHPKNQNNRPVISSSMLKTPITGVDETTTIILNFTKPSGLHAQAVLTSSLSASSPNPGATIRYQNGNILINRDIAVADGFTVQYFDTPGSKTVVREEKKTFTYIGTGWHFQADEVARCVRDGKLESESWGHEKSLLVMDIFDEVRRQGGYKFPKGVEQVIEKN